MSGRLTPLEQIEVAYVMIGNALRYGPGVVSTTDAEKWLEYLHSCAKLGAAVAPHLPEEESKSDD